jgi:Leucine-rich repeat (LRR) protein
MDAGERQALSDLLKGTGVTAEQLRSIGIRGIDRNARAIAIEGGHVIGLRLSNVTLSDLSPLRRMTALQALWLTDCGLTSVDGLFDLPQLTDLNLDGNGLTSLAALRGLPALKKLSARNNKLTEKPGAGLPPKVALALDGNPLGQAAAPAPSAAPAAAATGAGGVVPQLPKADGKVTGKGPHSIQGTLGSNTPFVASGVYDTLSGAKSLRLIKAESVDSTVDAEVSVETGRVRLYLEEADRKNFRFVEATPGKPAQLRGRMVFDFGQFGTLLESVDGPATMVRYRLSRASR